MPGPELEGRAGTAPTCPSCGALLSPGAPQCPSCGAVLGPAPAPGGFEEVEDQFEDEGMEGTQLVAQAQRCPRCDALITPDMTRCGRCGYEVRFPSAPSPPPPPSPAEELLASLPLAPPAPPQAPPPAPAPPEPRVAPASAPPPAPPAPSRVAPPAPLPSPGPPPLPPPASRARGPASKVHPRLMSPEDRRAARERFMVRGSQTLLVLGVADALVWAVPQLWMDLYINLGMSVANLVIILYVLGQASVHYSAGSQEMSEYERRRVGRCLVGLLVFLLVPIHEVLNIFPLGYYTPSWTSYGPAGLVNPLIMLLGLIWAAMGIQGSRERMGYFGIWRCGVVLLIIPPILAIVQVLAPILVSPEWFHQTVGLVGGAVMGIAFLVKRQRDRQFEEMETALRWGDAYAARAQYVEALMSYDSAINAAHTLFSHMIYNPDNPYSQVRVPPAYAEPWFRKGRLLARLGRQKKALAIFDMILEMDPGNLPALLTEAEILGEMGEFDAGVRACDRALALAPGHPDAMRIKAGLFREARRAEEERERARGAEAVFEPSPPPRAAPQTAPAGP